ncbi:BglG family transcription antiterminator [Niallia sp. SS-2023]|uniref:BglG family transcription antiterminator n=1 Tax=Niallia sp. SS-2023 TaxID=3051155 RepID=UPI0025517BEB|nr:BglG family transcription antiterminator [Niallia sp. SS-2023]MDL0437008.1 BglG family transcription antiterminator [Niallia sp. SS-2023]
MLSGRQRGILLLLSRHKEPVTAEWIAKELSVSDRTIRKELKNMQGDCKQLGVSISPIKGKGYCLHILDHEVFQQEINPILTEADSGGYDFSDQKTRVHFLLKHLLLQEGYVKLEQFEREMYVSKSTIQKDLRHVREMLGKYKLSLLVKPHYGVNVAGSEYRKRLCFANYRLMEDSSKNNSRLSEKAFADQIKRIIINKVNVHKIEISDVALGNLTNHIVIACKRMEQGFAMGELEHTIGEAHPFEKKVALEIIGEVEALAGFSFPSAELEYIIIHLMGTKLLHENALTEYREFDETREIVSCMVTRLKEELNWDFTSDREFLHALALHIRPAINRLRFEMNIRNPLVNDIKVKYPSAFEGAIIASKCLEDWLSVKVEEDEIGYIALHIGVALERMKRKARKQKRVILVCASGVGSAKLLSYRLQEQFSRELEIVECINYYKLADYDLSAIDLVISTIPIAERLAAPVQVVSNFLEADDIKGIKKRLTSTEKATKDSYLAEDHVFIGKQLETKEAVIEFLSNILYEQGLVSKQYGRLVLEREEIASTSFGNLVAIPHPTMPETKDTFWTVCTLAKPISWNENQMVQVVCLLNISKDAKGDLEEMYEQLISIIEDKRVIQQVIKAKSKTEVIELFQTETVRS